MIVSGLVGVSSGVYPTGISKVRSPMIKEVVKFISSWGTVYRKVWVFTKKFIVDAVAGCRHGTSCSSEGGGGSAMESSASAILVYDVRPLVLL
jgi:hypothetical protein